MERRYNNMDDLIDRLERYRDEMKEIIRRADNRFDIMYFS